MTLLPLWLVWFINCACVAVLCCRMYHHMLVKAFQVAVKCGFGYNLGAFATFSHIMFTAKLNVFIIIKSFWFTSCKISRIYHFIFTFRLIFLHSFTVWVCHLMLLMSFLETNPQQLPALSVFTVKIPRACCFWWLRHVLCFFFHVSSYFNFNSGHFFLNIFCVILAIYYIMFTVVSQYQKITNCIVKAEKFTGNVHVSIQ